MEALPLNPKIYFEFFENFPGLIALLDERGNIIATNETWRKEALKRGLIVRADGVGYNYLQLCDSVEGKEKVKAKKIKEGLLSVIQGKSVFFSSLYSFFDPQAQKEFFYLLLFFPLQRYPKIFVMTHIEIPSKKRTSQKDYDYELKREEVSSKWYYFLEGIIEPFLMLLEDKLAPELEILRKEILDKIKGFKEVELKSLHPLALFSTKEAQIALLVKEGKTSEEIAKILNLSKSSVDFYRKRIRSKLGIKGKNLSLSQYLRVLYAEEKS